MTKYFYLTFVLLLAVLYLLVPVVRSKQVGIAYLAPTESYGIPKGIEGYVKFTFDSSSSYVFVHADITGLSPNNIYAIHVHNFGDLTDNSTGLSTGEHYAGSGSKDHGCPPNKARHEGDMGNWTSDGKGIIKTDKVFDLLQLAGSTSIIGRAVVLHEKFDNCTGPSGFAGNRLGVGVIGVGELKDNQAKNGDSPSTAPLGVAVLVPTSDAKGICGEGASMNPCGGIVYFKQRMNGNSAAGIEVTANVSGLKIGSVHGFHIHEYGDLTVSNGSSAGAHWNPDNHTHNLPPYMPRHKGDLGNIQSYDSTGNRNAWYYDNDYSYIRELSSVFGRMIVIHEKNDHGNGTGCDQAGGAGKRVLWGVIGVANTSTVAPKVPSSVSINNNYVIEPCNSYVNSSEGSSVEDVRGDLLFLAVFGGLGWGMCIGLCIVLTYFFVQKLKRDIAEGQRMDDEEQRVRILF